MDGEKIRDVDPHSAIIKANQSESKCKLNLKVLCFHLGIGVSMPKKKWWSTPFLPWIAPSTLVIPFWGTPTLKHSPCNSCPQLRSLDIQYMSEEYVLPMSNSRLAWYSRCLFAWKPKTKTGGEDMLNHWGLGFMENGLTQKDSKSPAIT